MGFVLHQQLLHRVEPLAILLLEVTAVDARRGAEGQHDVLLHPIAGRQFLPLRQLQVARQVAVEIAGVGKADIAEIGVCPRAEACVGQHLPILQIVAALETVAGKVGYFVLMIAMLFQVVHRPQVHLCLQIVVGQRRRVAALVQGRALLYLQAIAAQVLHLQRGGGAEGVLPLFQRLMGQAVNKVEADILNFRHPCRCHGIGDLFKRMYPPDLAEQGIVGGLDAEGDAVEACAAQRAQRFPIPCAVGVALHGDLRVGGEAVALFHGFQKGSEPRCPQIRGGAAAKIHRVHRHAAAAGCHLFQVAGEGGAVSVHVGFAACQGVEVAVGALLLAEGDVEIETQCVVHRLASSWVRRIISMASQKQFFLHLPQPMHWGSSTV